MRKKSRVGECKSHPQTPGVIGRRAVMISKSCPETSFYNMISKPCIEKLFYEVQHNCIRSRQQILGS